MRWKIVAFVGCLAPAGGCHLYQNAMMNIVNEPVQYLDDQHLERQLRRDAKHAWAEVCRQYPKRTFTDDFVEGFCDGYTDYLDNGGSAQVPAVPPLKYRRSKFYNPEGHERIRQYFLGFKYGMDVAISTGCRTFLTVPVVLPETAPPAEPNITILPSPPDTATVPLPAPRPVSPPFVGPTDPMNPIKPATPELPPMKPGDKDKTPSDQVKIPVPALESKKELPTDHGVPPIGSTVPTATIAAPSGNGVPTPDSSKNRPLFPISVPDPASPILPMAGTAAGDRAGPILDLPPTRPPLIDLPGNDR